MNNYINQENYDNEIYYNKLIKMQLNNFEYFDDTPNEDTKLSSNKIKILYKIICYIFEKNRNYYIKLEQLYNN